jgi:hypothetical protein
MLQRSINFECHVCLMSCLLINSVFESVILSSGNGNGFISWFVHIFFNLELCVRLSWHLGLHPCLGPCQVLHLGGFESHPKIVLHCVNSCGYHECLVSFIIYLKFCHRSMAGKWKTESNKIMVHIWFILFNLKLYQAKFSWVIGHVEMEVASTSVAVCIFNIWTERGTCPSHIYIYIYIYIYIWWVYTYVLQVQRTQAWVPALPDFLRSSGPAPWE